MRLGFFGGSFDPPHLGHIAIAQAAADRFSLETILWAPAGRQPLKGANQGASYADRLAMVRLACLADARCVVSLADAPKPDGTANYTVDTLRGLRADLPDAEIYCLAGADSFADLGRWRAPDALLDLAQWIVISRPGFTLAEPVGMTLDAGQRARIHLLDEVHVKVSATELRRRLGEGDPCDGMLAPAVQNYIQAHALYGSGLAGKGRVR